MPKIFLIGVPTGGQLGAAERRLVSACGCLVVGRRFRRLAAELHHDLLAITPLKAALAGIEERLADMDVAVLVGGDPLFFGIGRTLINRFGRERLEIRPGLSAMQYACSRFKETWDDAVFLSFHGRNDPHIAARIMQHDKVFCLTDQDNSPALIARALIAACRAIGDDELAAAYTVRVGEDLGLEEEKITRGGLDEIASGRFSPLNVMLLTRPGRPKTGPVFGLSEGEIRHSRGLITKNEVRAATLHQLRLPEKGVFWDIGAGSGSISLEAARLNPALAVYAVERRPEQLANIRANCKRFGVYNITIIAGEAPRALADLPDPDRVFVGGSGGRLAGIIATATGRLKEGGRVVVNGVIEKTRKTAPDLLHKQGLRVEISEINIRRRTYPGGKETIMNPIAIMVGKR